jgi:hypothetical protein
MHDVSTIRGLFRGSAFNLAVRSASKPHAHGFEVARGDSIEIGVNLGTVIPVGKSRRVNLDFVILPDKGAEGPISFHGHGNRGGRNRTTGARDRDGIGTRRGAWIAWWGCGLPPLHPIAAPIKVAISGRPTACSFSAAGCGIQTKAATPWQPPSRRSQRPAEDVVREPRAGCR